MFILTKLNMVLLHLANLRGLLPSIAFTSKVSLCSLSVAFLLFLNAIVSPHHITTILCGVFQESLRDHLIFSYL